MLINAIKTQFDAELQKNNPTDRYNKHSQSVFQSFATLLSELQGGGRDE
jgi:hypothetical protein